MVSVITVPLIFLWATSILQLSCSRSLDDNSQLKSALQRGDVELAKHMILEGAILDYSGPKEKKSVFKKLRVVQSLLFNGIAIVNKQEPDLEKASCKECEFDVVLIPGSSLIMRLTVNVTAVKTWGNKTINDLRKPIHIICLLPDVSPGIVQKILEISNDHVNSKADSGITPLMLAADNANLEVVKFLLERGAKINDVATLSVNDGEDFEFEEHFYFAKLFSKTKLKNTSFQIHYTALVASIIASDINVIKYMISKGADVNINGQSWMALFPAIDHGQTEIVKILLRSGTNVNGKNILGSTALHKAATSGHLEIAKILVKNGASLNATDDLGWTPLHVASFFSELGGKEMIRFLVQSGSSIQSLTYGGYSPLNLVEAGYNLNFLSFLMKNIDSLNETKNYTDLPEENTKKMHSDIVDSVIQLGASLNHQDGILGWSTLHWAAASGDLDVAKLLVKYGAVISVRSKEDLNPFETATKFGRKEVSKFLKTAKDLVT